MLERTLYRYMEVTRYGNTCIRLGPNPLILANNTYLEPCAHRHVLFFGPFAASCELAVHSFPVGLLD